MSTAIIDNIDWLKYMRVYGSADADSFEEHFDTVGFPLNAARPLSSV